MAAKCGRKKTRHHTTKYPPPIVNDKLINVVPVTYVVDETSTDTKVTVDGKNPVSLPNLDGPGKTALVNVGTEGAHVLQITAKHCETSSEFGYYCSPESIYTATIISDFTPAGAVVESIVTLPDSRMQVNYRLNDVNANLGGTISYGSTVTTFDTDGKSSLIFDFREKNINQVKVQVCDAEWVGCVLSNAQDNIMGLNETNVYIDTHKIKYRKYPWEDKLDMSMQTGINVSVSITV